MKTLKLSVLLCGIPAMLLFSYHLASAWPNDSKEEQTITITPRSLDGEGAPRSATLIVAYYDTETTCVCATLSNAGTSVAVEFLNHTTNETAIFAISGSGSSVMPISGTPGFWSVTFTLGNGDIYYGEFFL